MCRPERGGVGSVYWVLGEVGVLECDTHTHTDIQQNKDTEAVNMANRGAGICLLTPRLCCFSHANPCLLSLSVGDPCVCACVCV